MSDPQERPAWLDDPDTIAAVRLPMGVTDVCELLTAASNTVRRRGKDAYVEQVGRWMVATERDDRRVKP